MVYVHILFIGIGVDDMFVIVSSWQSSKPPKLHNDAGYSFVARYSAKCLGAVVCAMFYRHVFLFSMV